MKARARDSAARRVLRVTAWGQVIAYEPGEDLPARIVDEILLQPAADVDGALALADRWRALDLPSFVPVAATAVVAQPGGPARVLQVERLAPRGSTLAEVLARCRAIDAAKVAALLLDLTRALLDAHARGLVAGLVAPDTLVLCPPGQDDLPPVRLMDAGRPQLLALAGHPPHDADAPELLHLLPALETAAPEVLAGQATTAASDAYGLCSTAAFALLGRHLHAAPTPAQIRRRAEQGPTEADREALQALAGPLAAPLLRGLSPNPWNRAGALADLAEACQELAGDRPTMGVAGRRLVAPWAVGSALIPLAAYAGSAPWAERLTGALPEVQRRASRSALPVTEPQVPTGRSPADQAKLRAALQRLEVDRAEASERQSKRDQHRMAKVAVTAAVALAAAALVALGLRQTRKIEESSRVGGPKGVQVRSSPPPPRPRPHDLPSGEPER